MKAEEIDRNHTNMTVMGVAVKAPLARYGFIKFYKLPVGWICGDCGLRVVPSWFEKHARKEHGRF